MKTQTNQIKINLPKKKKETKMIEINQCHKIFRYVNILLCMCIKNTLCAWCICSSLIPRINVDSRLNFVDSLCLEKTLVFSIYPKRNLLYIQITLYIYGIRYLIYNIQNKIAFGSANPWSVCSKCRLRSFKVLKLC